MKKKINLRIGTILLTGLLVTACGTNSIKPDIKKQIRTTEVRIIIKQPEIYAAIEQTQANASPFGLLMMATDGDRIKMRQERADKAIKPVVKAMKGYKVKSLAQRVYNSGLKKVTWMKPAKVKVVNRALTMDEQYDITRKSKADAVLFVELDYRLTESFKGFEVVTKSDMYRQVNTDPANKPETVYRSFHSYKWDLPNNAGGIYDRDKLGKKWSEGKAATLKQKIREGLDAEAEHLVKELQRS